MCDSPTKFFKSWQKLDNLVQAGPRPGPAGPGSVGLDPDPWVPTRLHILEGSWSVANLQQIAHDWQWRRPTWVPADVPVVRSYVEYNSRDRDKKDRHRRL